MACDMTHHHTELQTDVAWDVNNASEGTVKNFKNKFIENFITLAFWAILFFVCPKTHLKELLTKYYYNITEKKNKEKTML